MSPVAEKQRKSTKSKRTHLCQSLYCVLSANTLSVRSDPSNCLSVSVWGFLQRRSSRSKQGTGSSFEPATVESNCRKNAIESYTSTQFRSFTHCSRLSPDQDPRQPLPLRARDSRTRWGMSLSLRAAMWFSIIEKHSCWDGHCEGISTPPR